jgi:hypothetical protein
MNMDLKYLQEVGSWEWPPNAAEEIQEVLRDRQTAEDDRLIAIHLAGDLVVMDDEMADLLRAIVANREESAAIRAGAAISLGPVLEQTDTEEFDDPLSDPPISEATFHRVQATLRKVFLDESEPKEVRRRVLEGAVRATDDWLADAIRAAWARDDKEWKLTAVFAMRYVPGFESEILKALDSKDPEIYLEAIRGAGARELDPAWPHVEALIESPRTEKTLLLAAIEAAAEIRPDEAGPLLVDLSDSSDEEIAEAASEAMMMADAQLRADDDEDEEDDEDEDDEDDEEGPY